MVSLDHRWADYGRVLRMEPFGEETHSRLSSDPKTSAEFFDSDHFDFQSLAFRSFARNAWIGTPVLRPGPTALLVGSVWSSREGKGAACLSKNAALHACRITNALRVSHRWQPIRLCPNLTHYRGHGLLR